MVSFIAKAFIFLFEILCFLGLLLIALFAASAWKEGSGGQAIVIFVGATLIGIFLLGFSAVFIQLFKIQEETLSVLKELLQRTELRTGVIDKVEPSIRRTSALEKSSFPHDPNVHWTCKFCDALNPLDKKNCWNCNRKQEESPMA